MSCYKPAFIQRSESLITKKVTNRFIPHDQAIRILETMNVLKEKYDGKASLDFIPRTYSDGFAHDFIQIPCGKCIGCRIDYSRSWADRLTYHSFDHKEDSYFLTLTYDEEHIQQLPFSDNYGIYSLDYDDIRLFIKRLRYRFGSGVQYYLSGEYGDQQFRPHFHMIVFGIHLVDLDFFKLNDNGDPIYLSHTIEELWQKGIHSVSHFHWLNAAYTASYVEKKRDGRMMCEYTAVGILPEKCLCSRDPGIAFKYYEKNYQDLWANDGLDVSRSVQSSGHLGIPRYFRKLAVDKGIGYDEFLEYQKRCLDRSNILNPLKLERSSFDSESIQRMLDFEERELLCRSYKRNF